MTVHILNRGQKVAEYVNTTSHGNGWERGLSPFVLGPIKLYGRIAYKAKNFENAWQYAKVYHRHLDRDGDPSREYFRWARAGWANPRAVRYPMGRGAVPAYSWWDGEKLGYIDARKRIYAPLYAKAVAGTEAYEELKRRYKKNGEIWLWDFDGYDHRRLRMSFRDVLNCPDRKMGHAFVLAMMLEGDRVWEDK